MVKYKILELDGREYTYLELRILTTLECEPKITTITNIINFLNYNKFLINLSMLYYVDEDNQIRSERIEEHSGVPALSIDMRDDKMRFKYWDGSKIYWTYHTEDLKNCLVEGRAEFILLSEKYEPITATLFELKNKYNRDIKSITYKYYPENTTYDIQYDIKFSKYIKDHNMENRMLDDINLEISLLGKDVLKDVNFNIEYSFEKIGCTPCEEAKRKREEEAKRKREENAKKSS